MDAHHHSGDHSSPDDEYLPAPGSSYEHTDAHTRPVGMFMFWLAVAAIISHFGLAGVYKLFYDQGVRAEAAERRYPLAAQQEYALPPAPRLQQYPQQELSTFRREEEALMTSYGWQNKAAGTVHIPVSEAMRLIVEQGQSSASPAAAGAERFGTMPADSSGGRTVERRRQ